jgi:hypothetical protein
MIKARRHKPGGAEQQRHGREMEERVHGEWRCGLSTPRTDRRRPIVRATQATITRTAPNAAIFSTAFNRNAVSSAHNDCASSAAAIGATFDRKKIRAPNAERKSTMLASKSLHGAGPDLSFEVMTILRFQRSSVFK